ncbi:hypothetical protein OSB04_012825 [Centaurea solstitialis]|uniref:Purple acid phosphatase n=1 Tax=Centaurea solstitialis TaxID=347529 RepID=A0AA38TQ10_9ASTR|nr:hypothetical protein OSB04_012825 [Centaurea solstitialis]
MKAEMQSMYDNQVWELTDLPQHCKAVGRKWVFKKKTDMDGNVHTFKARLVAKGFTQTHGIDYDETFSPVAMLKSIRILMTISAYFNYEIWQMDVKTAFLNGKLTEDVYMEQPEGFEDPKNPNKVCKLLKSIYGLKQASRSWNLHFDERIKEFGFAKSKFEPCVYTKFSGSIVTFLVLYVDDILLIGNDVPTLQSVKEWLSKCFQMKDLGEAAYILGIKIYRNRSKRLIGLSQSTYIDKVLKRFRMDESKKGFIPMQHGIVLSKTQCPVSSEDQDKMKSVPYASAIGSIMYAMLCTRPDVAYSVSVTSRYQQNPGEPHWVAVKNILKYLRRTKEMFLVFGGSEDEISVTGYSDASFQTDRDDFRSQSGYVFTLNGGAISWKSSKQDTIADSTTEAEYIAACDAAKEAVWLRNFLSDLRVVASISRPIDIFCDDSGAVAQAKEPREHHKSRHVLRKYHLIREIIGRGDVRICKIPTEDNVADPLTKPLARAKHEAHANSIGMQYLEANGFRNYTAISDFRLLNRRKLGECPNPNPYVQIQVSSTSELSDDEMVTVTVSGVVHPSKSDWVGMISPSHANVNACLQNLILYEQTGDFSALPLLCHYPVKAQFVSNDPGYMGCKKKECKKHGHEGKCLVTTCSASLTFHVINIRTDIQFVLFGAGFQTPCVLAKSSTLKFANPSKPLHGHLASIDSTGTSMRLTWVSGDKSPQQVQYANGKSQTSSVTTFSQENMCTSVLPSPAKDFGWHDPGYIHSAVMNGLKPSTQFSYRYGSNSAGWSARINFKTPPSGGSNELTFLAFGDMGKAPRDASVEHYIQPGSLAVVQAMADEVSSGNIDSIFHIGDISYATGFLVEWDFFLHLISPVASQISYMTAIGNHERDYIDSGSVYITPDSGGECGVAYETYFPMPTPAKDKPWYSIEQGSVHFVVISTEHDWSQDSEQYQWMSKDMAAVDRSRTPWVIFTGHRPMYSSCGSVDDGFVKAVEPLLVANKVDLVLFGHVHNYERTCAVYKNECKATPKKGRDGVDTYDNGNYEAPVHVIIGMAGFKLDTFPSQVGTWSLSRITEFGYARVHTTKTELNFEIKIT